MLQAAQLAQRLWQRVQRRAVLEHQLLQLLQAADAVGQRAQRVAVLQFQPLQRRQAACSRGKCNGNTADALAHSYELLA
jgi:hypothetical protein